MANIEEVVIQCLERDICDPKSQVALHNLSNEDVAQVNKVLLEMGIMSSNAELRSRIKAAEIYKMDEIGVRSHAELKRKVLERGINDIQKAMNEVLLQGSILETEMLHCFGSTIEGLERLEEPIGQMVERVNKSNADALYARFQEETTKNEQKVCEIRNAMTEEIRNAITNWLSYMVKELEARIGPALAPVIEDAVTESFRVNVEAVCRTSLEAAFRSYSDTSEMIIPLERAFKSMFEQIESAWQKGMAEYTRAFKSIDESIYTRGFKRMSEQVASAWQEGFAEYTRALQLEAPKDPTELPILIEEKNYEAAFTLVLRRSDVSLVSQLCSQMDLHGLLKRNPLPLSQQVLLSLLDQLASDICNDPSNKLAWMKHVVEAINTSDQIIADLAHPVFTKVRKILDNHALLSPPNLLAILDLYPFLH